MPRQPRFALPGQPQHIIQVGNNRQNIFHSDRDYRYYLSKLEEKCFEHKLYIHSYVLMPNHTHILATPYTNYSVSKVLQSLGRCYAQYFNHTHNRTGSLFEGRYRATIIDASTYLLKCYQYIEQNPVRAGLVAKPSEYCWSSHRYNALGVKNDVLTPHRKYMSLSSDTETRYIEYQKMCDVILDESVVNEITEATNKSWVLGSSGFKSFIEKSLNRRSSPKPRGGDRKSVNWIAKQC